LFAGPVLGTGAARAIGLPTPTPVASLSVEDVFSPPPASTPKPPPPVVASSGPVAVPVPLPSASTVAPARPLPPLVPLPPAPQAFDNAADTLAGEVVDIPVLADDTGEGPTVLSRTNPRHGLAVTLTSAEGPTVVRYTPGPGFTGVDLFRYTLVDRFGRRADATVRVTVSAPPTRSARPSRDHEDVIGAAAPVARVDAARVSTAGADGEALLWTMVAGAVLGGSVLASVAGRRVAGRHAAHGRSAGS